MHFDLIDLRLFLHTLTTGNITAAAARSHLSLAAASARIRALEASLGTPLLERNRRGVTPTAAGIALGQHSRQLFAQVEHLQFDLAQYAQGLQGQVRLLCNTAALTEYLPELLADFLKRLTNVSLDVQELPSVQIAQALRAGNAELGVISDAVDTSGLQVRPFRDDPLVLVMPRDHALAGRLQLSFADALEHAFVGLAATSALALHLHEQARQSGRELQVRVRAEGFDGVIRMVAHGAGLGIVPLASVQRWQAKLPLTCVALHEPWAARRLQLCARDFSTLPGYAQALVATLAPG